MRNNIVELAATLEKEFGDNVAYIGSDPILSAYNVIPTGSLSLDFALGTGGWPDRFPVEVFGPPEIGKSTVMGFGAIREAQALNKNCALIALEPGFDEAWAVKNGVDPDRLLVVHPDNGEEAFTLLYKIIVSGAVGYVVFDSIGALLKRVEQGEEGKPNAGGQAGLITWGVKNAAMAAYKNRVGVMYLNQIRDDMGSYRPGMYESPGGHAVKHTCLVRVNLRPGKDRFTEKVYGEDVMVGRSLIALVKKNQLSEGTNQKAIFNFYAMETDDRKIGVDLAQDVINIGMRTGIIKKGGTWYTHPTFPDKKLQGKVKISEFIEENPHALEQIREEVLTVMRTLKRKAKSNGKKGN